MLCLYFLIECDFGGIYLISEVNTFRLGAVGAYNSDVPPVNSQVLN